MDALNWLSEFGRRLLMLFRRGQFDRDLNEEMHLHRELREQEQVEAGVSPEEARYAVQRGFGNDLVLREESRDMWGWHWLENTMQDVRYGLRQLRRSPGFTAVAVLTLALGIGANTAIFQLVDAVRLRTLPVKNPQQLARIQLADTTGIRGSQASWYPALTNPLWEQICDHQQVFSGVFAWSNFDFDLAPAGERRPARGLFVSGDFFRVLGVQPTLGRVFTANR